ncbi:methionyl-tRNA formyltransferase [Neorhizobium galegae]|uniref:formyl transferase n=1 Tax=Neorhizobium galegae TaxID=399 RepID=UPI001AEA8A41|nr:formyltransferase family protein [Neorhizobium galegae]MBP2549212.1 methionyl-tRNA formyltransferase [Neorhizobium galegae]
MQHRREAKVVVLTSGGLNPQVMINALAKCFPKLQVLQEDAEPKRAIYRRRAKRLGRLTALGQLATMALSRLAKQMTLTRTEEILEEYRLWAGADASIRTTRVSSLNSREAQAEILRLKPDVVFLISCRALSRGTLAAISCPILNFHAGINPIYRGQMGGYWALAERDAANFGATVHLVDAGLDTGDTLYEVRPSPSRRDSIATYPLLLTAAGTQISIRAIDDALLGQLQPYRPPGRSVLRYPPPIWTYLLNGLTRGIW